MKIGKVHRLQGLSYSLQRNTGYDLCILAHYCVGKTQGIEHPLYQDRKHPTSQDAVQLGLFLRKSLLDYYIFQALELRNLTRWGKGHLDLEENKQPLTECIQVLLIYNIYKKTHFRA